MIESFLKEAAAKNISVEHQVPLAPFTTMKIGGPAEYHTKIQDKNQLVELLKLATAHHIPSRILGNGSNVLIADKGYPGLVIINQCRNIDIQETAVYADSGVLLGLLIPTTVNKGLAGFETLAGIPGSVGGALHHNAGTRMGEIKDITTTVDVYNEKTGQKEIFTSSQCGFEYRSSFFAKNDHLFILGATFQLKKENLDTLKKRLLENMAYKAKTQITNQPNSGCTFRNYVFKNEEEKEKAKGMHLEAGISGDRLHTSWLLDHMGLKGFTVGKIQVSKVHANFLINTGGGTAEQVVMLIGIIKQKVRDTYGIQLQEEIQFLGL